MRAASAVCAGAKAASGAASPDVAGAGRPDPPSALGALLRVDAKASAADYWVAEAEHADGGFWDLEGILSDFQLCCSERGLIELLPESAEDGGKPQPLVMLGNARGVSSGPVLSSGRRSRDRRGAAPNSAPRTHRMSPEKVAPKARARTKFGDTGVGGTGTPPGGLPLTTSRLWHRRSPNSEPRAPQLERFLGAPCGVRAALRRDLDRPRESAPRSADPPLPRCWCSDATGGDERGVRSHRGAERITPCCAIVLCGTHAAEHCPSVQGRPIQPKSERLRPKLCPNLAAFSPISAKLGRVCPTSAKFGPRCQPHLWVEFGQPWADFDPK